MVTPMEFSKNNLGGIEESLRPFITELTHLCIGRWCTVTSEWTLEISSAAETYLNSSTDVHRYYMYKRTCIVNG